jgi:hypothetical protein
VAGAHSQQAFINVLAVSPITFEATVTRAEVGAWRVGTGGKTAAVLQSTCAFIDIFTHSTNLLISRIADTGVTAISVHAHCICVTDRNFIETLINVFTQRSISVCVCVSFTAGAGEATGSVGAGGKFMAVVRLQVTLVNVKASPGIWVKLVARFTGTAEAPEDVDADLLAW